MQTRKFMKDHKDFPKEPKLRSAYATAVKDYLTHSGMRWTAENLATAWGRLKLVN
jgi:hypothetical protein